MTFSIVARCLKSLALGVAVATAVPAVGSCVPHVEADVAAIATQALTGISYGIEGLKLLKTGLMPQEALETMLSKDSNKEKRQVTMVDAQGRIAAFTGKETVEWKGHRIRKDCVVAGNMLTGSQVLEAMTQAFEDGKGNLAERLLKALETGQSAGGDKRGCMSAALKVAGRQWRSETRSCLDLRVDVSQDPVSELRKAYEVSLHYFKILQ